MRQVEVSVDIQLELHPDNTPSGYVTEEYARETVGEVMQAALYDLPECTVTKFEIDVDDGEREND